MKKTTEKKVKAAVEACCDEDWSKGCCEKKQWNGCSGGCGGAFYGLGVLGAAIHYISTANGFWMGVLGVLKALVWPVFLVHGLLRFLGL